MRKSKVKIIAGLISISLVLTNIMPTGFQVSASEINQEASDVNTDDLGEESEDAEGESVSSDEMEEENPEQKPEADNENGSEESDDGENGESTEVEENEEVVDDDGVVQGDAEDRLELIASDNDIARGTCGNILWLIDVSGKLTIEGTGDFSDGTDKYRIPWFEYRSQITSAEVNVKGMTDASYMFYGCKKLTSIDLSNFDTSNVTTMKEMFCNCILLNALNLRGFETGNVTDMKGMFHHLKVARLDLSNFNTGKVTDFSYMFEGCRNLTSLDLSNFNTDSAFHMARMFSGCSSLTSVNVSSFNTLGVECVYWMFNGCSNLTEIDLHNFDVANVDDRSVSGKQNNNMFVGCKNLTTIHTPCNLKHSIPLKNGIWYTPQGVSVTELPRNLSYSIVLTKNKPDGEGQPSDGSKPVASIIVRPSELSLVVGDIRQLEVDIIPKGTTVNNIQWISSDPDVVSVDSTGLLVAVKPGRATITAASTDGCFTGSCDVSVASDIPIINNLTFDGDQAGITVDDSIPIIGGKTFSADLPASLPVNCVLEEGMIKIGININKRSLYSYDSAEGVKTTNEKKTIKEEFEEFKNDAMQAKQLAKDKAWLKAVQDKDFLNAKIPGMEKNVDVNCVGYVEGTWSNKPDTLQGSLVVTISGSATAQRQMLVWVIPVTVNCTFSASGSLTATVGYDFSNAKWYGELEALLNLGIEPYAGIGFGQWFSGGVYGKAQTDVDWIWLSSRTETGVKEWSISGEVGIKGYFAKKSASVALIEGTHKIIEDYRFVTSNSRNRQSNVYDAAESNSLEYAAVVTTLDATSGIQNYSVGTDGTLVHDVYNAAKPSLVTADGTTMLVYVADDLTRSTLDQTKLVYSVYDAATGTYSAALSVLDDGTADYEPEVYTDGKDIYVTWLDAARTFGAADDPELMDYMKTFRTHVAKYNPVTNSFEDLGSPQTGEIYTYLPRLYVSDGDLQLIWVENRDDALFGLSMNNTIQRAVYAGGEWTVADEINQLNSVTSIDIGETDSASGISIAYTLDRDNDLTTKEQDLYLRYADGNSTKVKAGNISVVSYTELPGVTGKVLAANIDGGLYYLNGSNFVQLLSDGTMNTDTEFRVSGNNIIYILSGDQNRNLAVATYDNGEWGNALLTHEEGYIDSFSIIDGKISFLYSKATHGQDGTWDVTSDIKIMESLDYDDVELESVGFALDDAYAGAALPVELYIKNNGISKVARAHVSVTYAGSEISSSDIDVNIMPGEVKPYDYSFTIPSDLSAGGDFTLTIMCDGDKDSGNNSQILSLLKADLEVISFYNFNDPESDAYYESDADSDSGSYSDPESGSYIAVIIENRGLLDTNMEMTIKDEEGNLLFSESELVEAGNAVIYREKYELEHTQILKIDVKGDVEEFYEMNNTTWLHVGDWRDYYPGDPGDNPDNPGDNPDNPGD
ncbi:MAG: BspA family leucine-rich repeat surface protein, partial [Lachnospiraceae bacterium]|nr:BspA family leucine-rich repeat surface protein [Lachnospiraceae bacterium]